MAESYPKFRYNTCNYIRQSDWVTTDSQFDSFLKSRWDEAKQRGYFRYNLDQLQTRILSGRFDFVAQLNMGRATLRRKPQEMMSLSQPFDAQKFNFTKVQSTEVLMELCREPRGHGSDGSTSGNKHVVIINVSPIEHCSILLVPSINSQLPQMLTQEALEVAMEMTILSAKRSLLVGYNSLCASASVNHLHFHAYYLEHKLRLQSEPTKQLSGPCHVMLSWPVPGFVFQLEGDNVSALARNVYRVAEYLHESEVAHNICLTRGTLLGEINAAGSGRNILRAFIWPRNSVYGVKDVDAFNVAFSELAGHLPIMNEKLFHDLTDQSAVDTLQHARLPPDKFKSIQMDVCKLFVG